MLLGKIMKINRNGKAAALSNEDYARIRRKLLSTHHKLIFDIARYTGERWGAILRLRSSDVWDSNGKPKTHITFRAATRKAAPSGSRQTRQVPIHPCLREALASHGRAKIPEALLFPSRKDANKALSFQAAAQALMIAVTRSGLTSRGISTHSTRISFITDLHNKGVSLRIIQGITGHHNIQVVAGYIEISEDTIANAIALL